LPRPSHFRLPLSPHTPAYVFFQTPSLPLHLSLSPLTRKLEVRLDNWMVQQLKSCQSSSSIKVLVFTPVSPISPNHSRLPLTGSDLHELHLSSSPSRHYFPRYRTHHMMKSAVVSRDRCSLTALAGHRWGSSPWSTAQT